jgi:hypothetical protein
MKQVRFKAFKLQHPPLYPISKPSKYILQTMKLPQVLFIFIAVFSTAVTVAPQWSGDWEAAVE